MTLIAFLEFIRLSLKTLPKARRTQGLSAFVKVTRLKSLSLLTSRQQMETVS